MMTALSPAQRSMIGAMYFLNGICYHEKRDRTLIALQQRGLVEFSRRRKYGRDCWHLTEAGTAEAAKREAQRKRHMDERALADSMCSGSGA